MNDITALAQRMKAAAKQSAFSIRHSVGMEVAADSYDFIEMTTPANVLALVEALEAEQQKSAKQGRHACELFDEVKQLQEQLRTVELSNSVLESRAVTVKLPEVERPIDGTGYAHAAGAQLYREQVIKSLAAAGIQVIEGEGQ